MALIETDILIEPTDVKIVNGDFLIGNSNNENIKHLCICNPGQFLISPTIGVGIYRYQNAPAVDARQLNARIREQLKNDGYDSIKTTGQTDNRTSETYLQITAERVKKPNRQEI